jgi:predicted kinase
MRKWMRDRLTRRKKAPAESSDQPAPPPLQPAYFDAEQQASGAAEAAPTEPEASDASPVEEAIPERIANSRPARRSRPPARQSWPEQNLPAQNMPEKNNEEQPAEAQPAEGRPGSSIRTSSTGRGRRRRGGRGRGGRGREQAVAQAFTPASVKGSIPGMPVDDDVADSDPDTGEAEAQPAAPAIAAASKTPAASVVASRPPKGVVVLAIGLPGSGKSSWFKRHDIVPLSSDMVRSLLFDDVREQRFQDLVFSNLRSMLKARLIAKRPMNYVDATNLTPQERQHWIKLAKDYQYEVHAVFFDVPLEVCIERHQRRDRVVPEDVMRRMAAKLKAPAFEEGFAKITVVRVKKKDEGSPAETPAEA